MQPISISAVIRNASAVLMNNLLIALFISMIAGGLGFMVTDAVSAAVAPRFGLAGQALLVASTLFQSFLLCLWAGSVGAWAAPAQLYLWVQREKQQVATLVGAMNYGLNRVSRVAWPHFLAYSLVVLGNIVIVPGIIFGLMFAFVDGIATLDPQEKRVLARSSRLTSSRRGSIFRVMLVAFIGWWLWFQLGLVFFVPTMPMWAKFGVGTFDHLVLVWIDLCMVQFYLDMFRKAPAAPAAAPALPSGTEESPWASTPADRA
jgi:hypothetical protein